MIVLVVDCYRDGLSEYVKKSRNWMQSRECTIL